MLSVVVAVAVVEALLGETSSKLVGVDEDIVEVVIVEVFIGGMVLE